MSKEKTVKKSSQLRHSPLGDQTTAPKGKLREPKQFKKGGNNHPTNGIALSKTAHWLFDHGFWSITNDLRVIVAEHRFEEVGEEAYLLKKMAGREMLRPANLHFLPDPQSLAWHREHHKFEGA